MIVTFVSECERKSLKLTRQVLDAYAHRIGRRTWQTVITEQGLSAVRSRLSASARKTTAVACHRIRGTRRSDLLWVVGNRRKFDEHGNVPVARTRRNLLREQEHSDWNYLPILKGVVSLAGLFHDFGKAWDPFQKMLQRPPKKDSNKRDPVRHEWISLILFAAMVKGKKDFEWLEEISCLANQPLSRRQEFSKAIVDEGKSLCNENAHPFDWLETPLTETLGWLLVSHHRLPGMESPEAHDMDVPTSHAQLLREVGVAPTFKKSPAPILNAEEHWRFRNDLAFVSPRWCKQAARWSRHLLSQADLPAFNAIPESRGRQLFATLCRFALVMGDHKFSATKEKDESWPRDWPIAANPVPGIKPSKDCRHIRQFLDEHLIGVAKAGLELAHFLPYFEHGFPALQDNRPLRRRSPVQFDWQNKAVDRVKAWKEDTPRFQGGFFAVNMASTGTGKTIANARIFNALSDGSLRLSVALGLRTLTRQTGAEYRNRLSLDSNELCVAVGGQSQRVLDAIAKPHTEEYDEFGSESSEELGGYFEFDSGDLIPDDTLSTLLPNAKSRQLLKCPLLVSTIDHLMPAVESQRGGRHLLPMLRLLSSDLVIDEIDDFDKDDLPAVSRLIHLAGMLGRRVLISSATLPPAVAIGMFRSYRAGWSEFSSLRSRPIDIACMWCDEFASQLEVVTDLASYETTHESFSNARCKRLSSVPGAAIRARAKVLEVNGETQPNETVQSRELRQQEWFAKVFQAAIQLHRSHGHTDSQSGKQVSIGVIRTANVDPCIDLSKYLLSCELPDDVDLRVLTYHARQVVLLRTRTEQFLDELVGRGRLDNLLDVPCIRIHASESKKPNLMCIVVASPVEEVGRDHDFDWAVIEPSSLRSIVQMAGRVRRHRGAPPSLEPNVYLPEFNLRAFHRQSKAPFSSPGFEGGQESRGAGYYLNTKSLLELIDSNQLADRIDSQSRITEPAHLNPTQALRDLEHQVLRNVLTKDNVRPFFPAGWIQCPYYLTNLAQLFSPFRRSTGPRESPYRLVVMDNGSLEFRVLEQSRTRDARLSNKKATHIHTSALSEAEEQRCLLPLDYAFEIDQASERLGTSRERAFHQLGELILPDDFGAKEFQWNEALGARRRVKGEPL